MYGPQKGFAQSTYVDQQATALAGMLANASEYNLVDSAYVGDSATSGTNGGYIQAGLGVTIDKPSGIVERPGINNKVMNLPGGTDSVFAGVVVRNQFTGTDANGMAAVRWQTLGNYARPSRAGCRIWVQLHKGTTTLGGKVYWIVADTTGHGLPLGSFSAEAIAGDTVEITTATFQGAFTAGSNAADNVALVEFGLA